MLNVHVSSFATWYPKLILYWINAEWQIKWNSSCAACQWLPQIAFNVSFYSFYRVINSYTVSYNELK